MVGPGAPFGAEVPPPPGANDWERFVAFTGTRPASAGSRRAASSRRPGVLCLPASVRLCRAPASTGLAQRSSRATPGAWTIADVPTASKTSHIAA